MRATADTFGTPGNARTLKQQVLSRSLWSHLSSMMLRPDMRLELDSPRGLAALRNLGAHDFYLTEYAKQLLPTLSARWAYQQPEHSELEALLDGLRQAGPRILRATKPGSPAVEALLEALTVCGQRCRESGSRLHLSVAEALGQALVGHGKAGWTRVRQRPDLFGEVESLLAQARPARALPEPDVGPPPDLSRLLPVLDLETSAVKPLPLREVLERARRARTVPDQVHALEAVLSTQRQAKADLVSLVTTADVAGHELLQLAGKLALSEWLALAGRLGPLLHFSEPAAQRVILEVARVLKEHGPDAVSRFREWVTPFRELTQWERTVRAALEQLEPSVEALVPFLELARSRPDEGEELATLLLETLAQGSPGPEVRPVREVAAAVLELPAAQGSAALCLDAAHGVLDTLRSDAGVSGAELTQAWTLTVELLARARGLGGESARGASFFERAATLLETGAERMDPAAIERAYRSYFGAAPRLPRKHQGPKHLLAHVLLDAATQGQPAGRAYAERLRLQSHSPASGELTPLVRLYGSAEVHPDEQQLIERFLARVTAWAAPLQPDDSATDRAHLWGSVQHIVLQTARDFPGYRATGAKPQAAQVLRSLGTAAVQKLVRLRDRSVALQRLSAQVDALLPAQLDSLFHLEGQPNRLHALTPAEMRVVRYTARQEQTQTEDPLNVALRPYFAARRAGSSPEAATAAFQRARAARLPEQAARLAGWLDATGGGLRGPEPRTQPVLLVSPQQERDRLVQVQKIALRNALEGIHALGGPRSRRLPPVPPAGLPTVGFLDRLESALEQTRSTVRPGAERELHQQLRLAAGGLRQLLTTPLEPRNEAESLRPALSLRVAMHQSPMDMLHLGWPLLGQSCFDLEQGIHAAKLPGNLEQLAVAVLFGHDAERPGAPPIARLTVGVDPETNALFALSALHASMRYDCLPAFRELLEGWSRTQGCDIFLPADVGFGPPGPGWEPARRSMNLPGGETRLAADFVGSRHRKVNGYLFRRPERRP